MDSDELTLPQVSVYLDSDRNGEYDQFTDPSFSGPYPSLIQVREQSYNVGVVPSTLGDFVIGRTASPGTTQFRVTLSSNTVPHIQIPLSNNLPPIAQDLTVTAFFGDAVTIVVINEATDPNNNIDVNSAIHIIRSPTEGTTQTSNGAVFYFPTHAKSTFTSIVDMKYKICDLADACSNEATITINFLPKPITTTPVPVPSVQPEGPIPIPPQPGVSSDLSDSFGEPSLDSVALGNSLIPFSAFNILLLILFVLF